MIAPNWLTAFDLSAPCPYDGQPNDKPMFGPWPASEWIDMTREPTEIVTSDEAGFIKTRKPAPVYRCFTCGAETTRRVPIALYRTALHAGEQQFRGEYRAECGACALVVAGREVKRIDDERVQ